MAPLLETVNTLSARWAEWMWFLLWQTALVGIVIWIVSACLKRASPTFRFWLWMLVPLKLIVVPLIIVSLPLLPRDAMPPSHPWQIPEAFIARPSATSGFRMLPAQAAERTPSAIRVENTAAVRPTLWTGLMAIWLAGVLFLLGRLALGWNRMRRLVAASMPTTDLAVLNAADEASRMVGLRNVPGVHSLVWQVLRSADLHVLSGAVESAHSVGLPHVPRIVLSAQNISPCVFGLFRPVVIIPADLTLTVAPGGLSGVLAHEFAHLRRHDPILGWLVALCEAFFFFNPFLYLAKKHILFERERACDELVLENGTADRATYAKSLVSTAELCAGAMQRFAPLPVMAESFARLSSRIKCLSAEGKTSAKISWPATVGLVVFALIALPGIVLAERPARETKSLDAKPPAGESLRIKTPSTAPER